MISTETIYWIIGIAACILLMFTHGMAVLIGRMSGTRWGAVPMRDLQNGKTYYVDFESMKDATTVGFKLIKRRYGPGGLFSEWMTIAEPFIVKDVDGKVEKLYTPRDEHIRQVMGRCEIEAGQLTEAQMYAAEYFTRWQEERVRNIAEIDTQADKHIKRLGEAVPYAGLRQGMKRQQGGGQNAYNRQ